MTETPILDESAVSEIENRAGDKWTVNTDTIRALCATVKHLRAELSTTKGQWAEMFEKLASALLKQDDVQSQLEQLRATLAQVEQERDKLRNALLPFALLDIRHLQDRSDHEPIWAINKSQITNGHIRKAQQLMQQAVDLDKSQYQGEM